MAKYRCIQKNFGFQNRLHEEGDVIDVSDAEINHPSMAYFEALEVMPKQSSAKKPEVKKLDQK